MIDARDDQVRAFLEEEGIQGKLHAVYGRTFTAVDLEVSVAMAVLEA